LRCPAFEVAPCKHTTMTGAAFGKNLFRESGQLGIKHTAAIELARCNITINAVMPGNIKTEGLDGLGAEYLRKTMKRIGSVEDIAFAALFFASDEAAYITSHSLVVDGGQMLSESLMAVEDLEKGMRETLGLARDLPPGRRPRGTNCARRLCGK
jgi:Enoyl-(Acyl carrier protein) reductase